MNSSEPNVGNMLLALGAIAPEDLSEAREISRSLKQPLLKVLIQSGFMPHEHLVVALEAINRWDEKDLNEGIARRAFQHAVQRGVTFVESLAELAAPPISQVRQADQRISTPKVGGTPDETVSELLTGAGIVSDEAVAIARDKAAAACLPIEQVLVSEGQLPSYMAPAIASLRSLLDKREVTGLSAAEILRKVHSRRISVHRAMAEMGLIRSSECERVRIGELLRKAGLVKEADLQEAVKLSVWNDSLIGKMLVICGFVEEHTLNNALRCQTLMREGSLKFDQAVITLHVCERCRCSVEDAQAQMTMCA